MRPDEIGLTLRLHVGDRLVPRRLDPIGSDAYNTAISEIACGLPDHLQTPGTDLMFQSGRGLVASASRRQLGGII